MAIVVGSDLMVSLNSLYDEKNDAYINDATVTVSVQSLTGTVIATGTLTYKTASDGIYEGVILASALTTIVAHKRYNIVVTAIKDAATYVESLCVRAQRLDD